MPTEALPETVKYFKVELSGGNNVWDGQIGAVHLYGEAYALPTDIIEDGISTTDILSFNVENNGIYIKRKFDIRL
ncbi:hypothetical protein E9993_00630 [Labilibacter sediminis]|nr:hypothetical protein E9993_00630 [Labilibacter sediminis]